MSDQPNAVFVIGTTSNIFSINYITNLYRIVIFHTYFSPLSIYFFTYLLLFTTYIYKNFRTNSIVLLLIISLYLNYSAQLGYICIIYDSYD